MISLNRKALEENCVTDIGNVEDAILYMKQTVEYFKTCSRNLTEEQLRRILILINILTNMEVR